MIHLHRLHKHINKSSELAIVRFFLAVGMACINTIWAIYMNTFGLSESTIGFLSSIFVAISLITAICATPFLEKINQIKIIKISLFVSMISYLIIAISQNLYVFLLLAGIITVFSIFHISAFSITFRDNTATKELNKAEGFLYALLNVGWLIGPLIAGFFLVKWGITSVFVAATLFFLISTVAFIFMKLPPVEKKRKKIDFNIKKNLLDFLKNKKLRLPYMVTTGIQTWWTLIYIYVPLFMIKQGLEAYTVGIFMALIVTPLIILEYNVGKWSKKRGLRPFFIIGFGGLAVASLILFFITNIILALAIMVGASVFASFIEPSQETFFFKEVKKKEEEKYYPTYLTSASTGSFLGRIVIAGVLLFLPERFAYLTIAILMIIFTIASFKIRKDV